jgi:2-methylcitrate dehydratase PrpD
MCAIEVKGKSDQTWLLHKKNPRGHPANPKTDAEIEEKFLKLTAKVIEPKQARSVLESLWH